MPIETVKAALKPDSGEFWRMRAQQECTRADALASCLRLSDRRARRWKTAAIVLGMAGVVCGVLLILT